MSSWILERESATVVANQWSHRVAVLGEIDGVFEDLGSGELAVSLVHRQPPADVAGDKR